MIYYSSVLLPAAAVGVVIVSATSTKLLVSGAYNIIQLVFM